MVLIELKVAVARWGGLQVIRDVTECIGNGNLDVETDSCHCVGFETSEAEIANHGWCVRVETTLRTIVAKGDGDVNPKAPVAELKSPS